MSQPKNPPTGPNDKSFAVEYIRYEAPAMLDTEALAKAAAEGTCGVCITGGSGVAEMEKEAES